MSHSQAFSWKQMSRWSTLFETIDIICLLCALLVPVRKAQATQSLSCMHVSAFVHSEYSVYLYYTYERRGGARDYVW